MLSESVEGYFKQTEEHCFWETEKSREAISGIFCYRARVKWKKISAMLPFDLTTTKWCDSLCYTLDTTRLISGRSSVSIQISCSIVSASLFSHSTYFRKVTTVSLPTSRTLFPLNVSITPFPFPRPCVSLFCFKFQPHRCLLQGMLVSLHISLLMLYLEHHSSCSCRASCMSPVSRFPFIICWWFNVETVRVSDGAYPTTHSH